MHLKQLAPTARSATPSATQSVSQSVSRSVSLTFQSSWLRGGRSIRVGGRSFLLLVQNTSEGMQQHGLAGGHLGFEEGRDAAHGVHLRCP